MIAKFNKLTTTAYFYIKLTTNKRDQALAGLFFIKTLSYDS
jgi:hypothetical protein